jgi:hypothetical protein
MAYTGSASDRLAAVRAAIQNALTAQMTSVRGRQLQFAQLKDLRAMERELQQEVSDAETNGGVMSSLAFPQGVQ